MRDRDNKKYLYKGTNGMGKWLSQCGVSEKYFHSTHSNSQDRILTKQFSTTTGKTAVIFIFELDKQIKRTKTNATDRKIDR